MTETNEHTELDDVAALLPVVEFTAENWRDGALCAQTDPESFFPEKGGSSRDAKATCLACPVRSFCLEWALEHKERFGIWGGLSERQRCVIEKARKQDAREVAAGLGVAA